MLYHNVQIFKNPDTGRPSLVTWQDHVLVDENNDVEVTYGDTDEDITKSVIIWANVVLPDGISDESRSLIMAGITRECQAYAKKYGWPDRMVHREVSQILKDKSGKYVMDHYELVYKKD